MLLCRMATHHSVVAPVWSSWFLSAEVFAAAMADTHSLFIQLLFNQTQQQIWSYRGRCCQVKLHPALKQFSHICFRVSLLLSDKECVCVRCLLFLCDQQKLVTSQVPARTNLLSILCLGLARTTYIRSTVYIRYCWKGYHQIYGHPRCIYDLAYLVKPWTDYRFCWCFLGKKQSSVPTI
jgi:hypothetical protein